ncbi:MAG: hypothetical protein OWQ59_03795 [Alicyclobacillaceae bacterium]|jgi:hypothetical protein|uniref:hypothetical protein n=1 Tax=Alicyclobacillus sp. SP_1 TaxID=2942475 RepID=UPI0021580056|nr:hypothetical protein [Alicyclobacillus sp. SP_1]MCY0887561.1 hypothetical protein [Alicyclobacillaceae bacterium]
MSRIVTRSIAVTEWNRERPKSFWDGKEQHLVERIIDEWWEMGAWWEGEGTRRMIRIETSELQWMDIECVDGIWSIYRIWD